MSALFLLLHLLHARRKPLKVGEDENMAQMKDAIGHFTGAIESPKAFKAEMKLFLRLFSSYTAQRIERRILDWDKIQATTPNQVIKYEDLPASGNVKNLLKLAVLKFNGGLGTSMGLTGAKSALEVKDGLTFLDIIIQQMKDLNEQNAVDVPLLLMTSFHTHDDTIRVVRKHAGERQRITTFNQSRFPRVYKDTLLPCPQSVDDDKEKWYPPGHGDVYNALVHTGLLDQLIAQGKEYLFVSNSDNLGATVDDRILQHMVESKAEFIMEVTDKTRADIQGGTLINYDGHIRLLEITQVPSEHVEDFQSARRFKVFNTNNLWINIKSLKRVMNHAGMGLDLITKEKVASDGHTVIQLETAAGSAMRHFNSAHGVHVPRSRFLPVKTCSDLLLLKSDLFSLQNARLVLSAERMFATTPVIKLGEHYRNVAEFQERFKYIPDMIDLDHLTVTGDVHFGRNVTLRGTVIISAGEGHRIDVPPGCTLENRLLSGDLKLTEL
ncbi:hypothetical protein PHLGIDRAFT_110014 [Phlebiopsis gigantea 11061_1 CR5-6]|uniref:UTP--glucose-1-phosphate uridylyltransferase n=1 Tax=Phlebiopsis gigantea (strain 11061_1 CR5-6) TaxID=745531 RepID=A0A0C3PF07_PHLG1|nr:hypothetical protein PHLGIDRAFT_110014 [Phlebiopsis gigantea 11061_1 CR5-6]